MNKEKKSGAWWQNLISQHKEKVAASTRQELKEDVNRRIYIADAEVNGKTVIALLVDAVVVDTIGTEPNTQDPDGYWLENSASALVKRMQALREQQFQIMCKKGGLA